MNTKSTADKWMDRVVNVAVLAFLLFALLRPGGIARQKLDEKRARDRVVRVAAQNWQALSGEPDGTSPVIVGFMDYQCPSCRAVHDSLSVLAKDHGVRVVYRHKPLSAIHPRAEDAARLAICSERQGVFDQVHEVLLTSSGWEAEPPPLLDVAEGAGVPDLEAYEQCFDDPSTDARLVYDEALADSLGIRATPSFVSPKGIVVGLVAVRALRELVSQQ